jgi:tetratricopeptide (TPR) repeat protein
LGYTLERLGDLTGAMVALGEGLQLAPKDPAGLVRLADLFLANQKEEEALPLYQRAYESSPDCLSALYGMGEIARRRKDFENAERYLKEALSRKADAAQVRYSLGQVLRQLGRREEAKAMLAKVDFDQLTLGAWVGCADPIAGRVQGLTVGSAAHLLRAAQAAFLGQEEVEEEEYRKAVAANPEDPVALRGLGSLLLRQGDNQGAREYIGKALSLDPSSATLERAFGQILLLQGEVPQAVAHLRRAVDLAPKFKEAHLILAEVYLQNNRVAEVLHHTEQALAVDPVNLQARVWRAMALLQAGREQDAVDEISQLMDDSPPEDPAERLRLSTLLIRLGEVERALSHFQAILTLDAPPEIQAQAHTRLGQVRLHQGQATEAVRHLRSALDLSPGLAEAETALKQALARQEE